MGLPTEAAGGSLPRSDVAVCRSNSTTSSPAFSAASAAMMPGPPALVLIATRSPLGNGCIASAEQ